MQITIPKLSLVVLIGPSGSGKSTFARKHFLPTEVLSSDYCRGLVSGDENSQGGTNDAFEVLHFIAAKRLAQGHLTVIDATNVQPEARRPLVQLAKSFHCLPVAIVLNPPEKVCHERNQTRNDRMFGPHVVQQQRSQLRRSLKALKREGFRHLFVMDSVEEIEAASIERVPLWNDRKDELGPFDIFGETDEFGLPVRYNWAAEYRGSASVVYGRTPVPEPEWLNRAVNVDTGCVFGGKLTALRYPENGFVSVKAKRTYCEPARPFLPDDSRLSPLSGHCINFLGVGWTDCKTRASWLGVW